MTTKRPPFAGCFDSGSDLLNWMTDKRAHYGDIYHASIYGGDVYVISDPSYAEHVLRGAWHNYRKGFAIKRVAMLLGMGLMASEGELWKKQRRMIQPTFHPANVAGFTNTIIEANASLLSRWEQASQRGERVNVTRDLSAMTLEITLRTIFGIDFDRIAPSFSLVSEDPSRNLQFVQRFRTLTATVKALAVERRAHSRCDADLLGFLIAARDRDSGQSMTDNQLANEVLTLVVAGHETTAATLNWLWYELSQNPEVERKLHGELANGTEIFSPSDLTRYCYVRQVIEETLRMYPAGWLMTRCALQDEQIDGYLVPSGTEVYISPYMIQRHPNLWDDPDRFHPDRFHPDQSRNRHPLATLPFSAGPRNCIGEHLARLEMKIHVIMIGKRLRLCYEAKMPLDYDLGVNLRNKYDFLMSPALLTAH